MKTSKTNDTRYLLPDNLTKKLFLDTLKTCFTVKQFRNTTEKFSILESFEWNLYKNKLLAIRHENHSISLWNELNLFDDDFAQEIEDSNSRSRFWWEFPDSEAKETLKPLLKLRALYPVYEGILKIEQFPR